MSGYPKGGDDSILFTASYWKQSGISTLWDTFAVIGLETLTIPSEKRSIFRPFTYSERGLVLRHGDAGSAHLHSSFSVAILSG